MTQVQGLARDGAAQVGAQVRPVPTAERMSQKWFWGAEVLSDRAGLGADAPVNTGEDPSGPTSSGWPRLWIRIPGWNSSSTLALRSQASS